MEIGLVLAGGIIGIVIGLTVVGGGSLMTPFLLWYGISPYVAMGTDLLYAAVTKSGGILVHQKQTNVQWSVVVILAKASILFR